MSRAGKQLGTSDLLGRRPRLRVVQQCFRGKPNAQLQNAAESNLKRRCLVQQAAVLRLCPIGAGNFARSSTRSAQATRYQLMSLSDSVARAEHHSTA